MEVGLYCVLHTQSLCGGSELLSDGLSLACDFQKYDSLVTSPAILVCFLR